MPWFELAFFPHMLSHNSLLSAPFHTRHLSLTIHQFTWFVAAHHNFASLSMSSKRTHRSIPTCKKCHKPVRGHTGPHGSLCRQPSSQFVTDVPASSHLAQEQREELANVHLELEASIKDHEAQIANLSAELRSMKLNSTPIATTKSMPIFGKPTVNFAWPTHAASSSTNVVSQCDIPKMVHSRIPTSFSVGTIPTSAQPSKASFSDGDCPAQLGVQQNINQQQIITCLQRLLQQLSNSNHPVPTSESSVPAFSPPSVGDLKKNPGLVQQADNLLSSIPVLAASDPNLQQSSKGKSSGDLTFSAPVKFPQLWPHQFVCRLDSSNLTYKDIELPQFVCGYIECLLQSSPSMHHKMLLHLSHLMDLASRFQWGVIRSFHARVLKAMEQGVATWESDLQHYQTGLLLPSQELPARGSSLSFSSNKRPSANKESVCKDWNFTLCCTPYCSDRLHLCFICNVPDHKALACPKHHCSPTCT